MIDERLLRALYPPAGLLRPRTMSRVLGIRGPVVMTGGMDAGLGEEVLLCSSDGSRNVRGVISGFWEDRIMVSPLDDVSGISPSWFARPLGRTLSVPVGQELLGRIIDATGMPLDGELRIRRVRPVTLPAPSALERVPVSEPFHTGISVLDSLITLGQGQRVGLFAGSGVGKSTFIGMLANSDADVIVLCLVGERGREVRDFLERIMSPDIRSRTVAIVSTSSEAAIRRVYAPLAATSVAEWFRDQGLHVLLLVDSVTRYARALRELGLSLGEMPARRGYPPGVFAQLPLLFERAGRTDRGAITGIYTVLVEGGDLEEPVSDEVRGLVDGHIVLSRELAQQGIYPAVSVTQSISRLFGELTDSRHQKAAKVVRQAFAVLDETRLARRMGTYVRGGDPFVDRVVDLEGDLWQLVIQPQDEVVDKEESLRRLVDVAKRLAGSAA